MPRTKRNSIDLRIGTTRERVRKHSPGSQGATSGREGSEHNKHDQCVGEGKRDCEVVGTNQTSS